MSKGKNSYSIGYESLLEDFKKIQEQAPKGISLKRTGKTIAYQFNLLDSRRNKASGCSFTLDGMYEALKRAKKLAEGLNSISSLVEFEQWYEREILQKVEMRDDKLTFGEAVALVEKDFWERTSRTGRKRDKNSPSSQSSYRRTYEMYYELLPQDKYLNADDTLKIVNRYQKGTKSYVMSISAMKKLARLAKRNDILEALNELSTQQTEFAELQTVTLDEFLAWRDRTLGITATLHPNADLDSRKRWLWAFSMQLVYGLRIHEVFAIKNLTEPFVTKDGTVIPALTDKTSSRVIVIGSETELGTTTKTGYRLARPLIPPSCPDLIERLEITEVMLPKNRPVSKNPDVIRKFYSNTAIRQLIRWEAPFTGTHALRHLANLHGMQAGISLEVRSQSLGHTPQMNESVYKKRQHTQETLKILLQSEKQAIDFVSALNTAKELVQDYPDSKKPLAKLLAAIYQQDSREISTLLDFPLAP